MAYKNVSRAITNAYDYLSMTYAVAVAAAAAANAHVDVPYVDVAHIAFKIIGIY